MSTKSLTEEVENTNHKLWFKAKTYGYGWYPVTWQGWSIIAVYLVYVLLKVSDFAKDIKESTEAPGEMTGVFLIDILVVTLALVIISYLSGEKASWRWGETEKKQ
jgi:hypothetical protein